MSNRELRYKDAGVDIEAGDKFAASVGALARATHGPEVIGGLGGFGGLFSLDTAAMSEPVLVSGTDGVGTKLLIAQQADNHASIGFDLVAMCVNDILTLGARPLFFLDYFATGKLSKSAGLQVVESIARACADAQCALIGGETAEMPGMYGEGKYDLAGFAVGVVDRPNIIDGSKIAPGHVIIGLASNGCHSNGFSLVRHVLFKHHALSFDTVPEELGISIEEELLKPTAIYTKAIMGVLAKHQVSGMAHITGGGIAGNLVRIIPENCAAQLNRTAWPESPIFRYLRTLGVPPDEMDLTFNLGLGYMLICPANEAAGISETLTSLNVDNYVIGHIEEGRREVVINEATL